MSTANFFQPIKNRSIRQKLIGTFLIITILPLSLLAYLSNQSSHLSSTQAANNSLFFVASQTAESIDNFLSSETEIIQIEAQYPLFDDYLSLPPEERRGSDIEDQIHKYLTSLRNLHSEQEGEDEEYLLGLSLLDRNGTILLDTHHFPEEANPFIGLDWSNNDSYLKPILQKTSYSSPIEIPQQSEFSSIFFSASIVNELNTPIGVLIAHYDGKIIQEIITEKNNFAGKGSFGTVFDEYSIYLAHGIYPERIFTTVANLDQQLLRDLQKAQRLPMRPISDIVSDFPELQAGLKGDSRFFAVHDPSTPEFANQVALATLKNRPWKVAFFQPENIFLESTRQQTTKLVLLSTLITLFSLGVAFLASQVLGNPIARLTSLASKVAAGDLSVQADITSTDEIGLLAQTFNGMTNKLRTTLEELEQRVIERTDLLQISSEVGRTASSTLNSDELINRVVHLITERFNYYYSAIFLVDELKEWAELQDATGEAGKILLANRHRLPIGGQSMVSAAVLTKQGRIALDVGEESVRFRNPLLPNTLSEIALPLIVGEEVIGVLDVQSTQRNAFSEQNIDTLQNMANQVAIAIQNARLYQQARTQLAEISRLNQTLLREGWQSFLKTSQNPTFQYSKGQIATISPVENMEIKQAVEERGPVFNYQDKKAIITLPLILREQVIGVLNLKANKAEWSQDDLMIINTVTRQAALAFENARLVEGSHQLAARERHINQITSNIHNASTVEDILKTTISELAKVLNVQEASIQLSRTKSSIEKYD